MLCSPNIRRASWHKLYSTAQLPVKLTGNGKARSSKRQACKLNLRFRPLLPQPPLVTWRQVPRGPCYILTWARPCTSRMAPSAILQVLAANQHRGPSFQPIVVVTHQIVTEKPVLCARGGHPMATSGTAAALHNIVLCRTATRLTT